MATIYRFIIEQKQTSAGNGRTPRDNTSLTKTVAKKGRSISFFGGDRGGVEHNRKMRAINPLINKMTGGVWEKSVRLGRASIGLGKNVTQGGIKGVLTGPALYIIIALILTTLMKYLSNEQQKAQKQNAQNFKQMENGIGAMNSQYRVSSNFWTGRLTYNQNK